MRDCDRDGVHYNVRQYVRGEQVREEKLSLHKQSQQLEKEARAFTDPPATADDLAATHSPSSWWHDGSTGDDDPQHPLLVHPAHLVEHSLAPSGDTQNHPVLAFCIAKVASTMRVA